MREDKANGNGDFRGHQDEKDQALSPNRATTFLYRAVYRDGRVPCRFRALVVVSSMTRCPREAMVAAGMTRTLATRSWSQESCCVETSRKGAIE